MEVLLRKVDILEVGYVIYDFLNLREKCRAHEVRFGFVVLNVLE